LRLVAVEAPLTGPRVAHMFARACWVDAMERGEAAVSTFAFHLYGEGGAVARLVHGCDAVVLYLDHGLHACMEPAIQAAVARRIPIRVRTLQTSRVLPREAAIAAGIEAN